MVYNYMFVPIHNSDFIHTFLRGGNSNCYSYKHAQCCKIYAFKIVMTCKRELFNLSAAWTWQQNWALCDSQIICVCVSCCIWQHESRNYMSFLTNKNTKKQETIYSHGVLSWFTLCSILKVSCIKYLVMKILSTQLPFILY